MEPSFVEKQKWIQQHGKYGFAGIVAGTAECIVGYPLDTIKSRLQTQTAAKRVFKGPVHCLQQTIVQEGYTALYRGISSSIIRSAISTSVLFGTFNFFKNTFENDASSTNNSRIFSRGVIAACVCTGMIEGIIYCPLEVVKLQMQTSLVSSTNSSTWRTAFKIWKNQGINGFYRGFIPTTSREMVGNVAYFGTYELIRSMLHRDEIESDLLSIAVAGGLAGVAYWTVVFPIDTVKSIVQSSADASSPFNVASRLYGGGGGISRFYTGMSPSILRALPANAVTFMTYETCLSVIDSYL